MNFYASHIQGPADLRDLLKDLQGTSGGKFSYS